MLELARAALEAPSRRLAKTSLPDPIRQTIERARRITSHIARKRETAYLAKLLRADPEAAASLQSAITARGRHASIGRPTNALRAQRWVERLIREGETALARLCAAHPRARSLPLKPLLLAARRQADPQEERGRDALQRLRQTLAALFASDPELEEE